VRERSIKVCLGGGARIPGGGVRGRQAEQLEGRGGLLGPGHQGAETSQAVPEPAYAFTLTRPAQGEGRGQKDTSRGRRGRVTTAKKKGK